MLSKRLWTESSRSTNKIFGFLYFLAVSNVLRLSVGCVLSSNIVFLRHKGIGRHQPWGRLAVIDNPHGADHDRSTGGRAFRSRLPQHTSICARIGFSMIVSGTAVSAISLTGVHHRKTSRAESMT